MADKTGQFELSVINRGRFPLKRPSIREYVFDRHDPAIRGAFEREAPYDALVDFCAYEPGDGKEILSLLGGKVKHYIEISSCAVFAPSREPRTEEYPLVKESPQNPVEAYAYKKALLEKEIQDVRAASALPYTIFRPCFVFGPFNYAPRESFYFNLLLSGDPIPHPAGSAAEFSFVYVRDVARAIMAAAGNSASYNRSYNLAGPERVNYRRLLEVLFSLAGGQAFPIQELTVEEVYERNIPLPFPLEQNELFDGTKARRELGLSYTGFAEGMKEAFSVYRASRK
ncbi:MAG: NAD-dependent epimerase/dehydratase family protein [Treponema sp.]|jgi:nucleoside-diphosphate-sugar epimerase|nr:NAD-dependent epimerase/dehydratase family protein [Treponema sp.]